MSPVENVVHGLYSYLLSHGLTVSEDVSEVVAIMTKVRGLSPGDETATPDLIMDVNGNPYHLRVVISRPAAQ